MQMDDGTLDIFTGVRERPPARALSARETEQLRVLESLPDTVKKSILTAPRAEQKVRIRSILERAAKDEHYSRIGSTDGALHPKQRRRIRAASEAVDGELFRRDALGEHGPLDVWRCRLCGCLTMDAAAECPNECRDARGHVALEHLQVYVGSIDDVVPPKGVHA